MNGRARLGTTGMHILAMVWLPCVALIAAACGTPAAGTLPPAEANATAAPAPVAAAPAATAARRRPSMGLRASKVAPDTAATRWPAISARPSGRSAAARACQVAASTGSALLMVAS